MVLLLCFFCTSLENTVGMENVLATSNFSFSHSVFYPFGELSTIFLTLKPFPNKYMSFENNYGKGEIARNKQVLAPLAEGYCHGLCPSFVRPYTFSLKNSSETIDWIFTKVHRNVPLVVLFQIPSNNCSMKT